MPQTTPKDVLTFWREAGPKAWFEKNDAFDKDIRGRFGETLEQASAGKLDHWTETPEGTLALIIVLDQFSRNLFRNDARSFAQDNKCVDLVNIAMASGQDRAMPGDLAVFAYMPLMHSESIIDQDRCAAEMMRLAALDNVKYAVIHRDVIVRFSRFPHRNEVLGRHTTPAEQAFLDGDGFKG